MKIISNTETLGKHNENLTESKRHLSSLQDMITKVDSKLSKAKEFLMDEIQGQSDSINVKIDTVDRFSVEGFQFAKDERARDREQNCNLIDKLREEFNTTLKE